MIELEFSAEKATHSLVCSATKGELWPNRQGELNIRHPSEVNAVVHQSWLKPVNLKGHQRGLGYTTRYTAQQSGHLSRFRTLKRPIAGVQESNLKEIG
jgi:hypothetical protein